MDDHPSNGPGRARGRRRDASFSEAVEDASLSIALRIEDLVPPDPPRMSAAGVHPDQAARAELAQLHEALLDDEWPAVWEQDQAGLGAALDQLAAILETYYAHDVVHDGHAIAEDPNREAVHDAVASLVSLAEQRGGAFADYGQRLARYWSLIERSFLT